MKDNHFTEKRMQSGLEYKEDGENRKYSGLCLFEVQVNNVTISERIYLYFAMRSLKKVGLLKRLIYRNSAR